MDILLGIGAFLMWAILKILTTFAFAVPAGVGLGAGFHLFNRWKNRNYAKNLEAQVSACPIRA